MRQPTLQFGPRSGRTPRKPCLLPPHSDLLLHVPQWTAPTTAPFGFAGEYAGGATEGSTLRVPDRGLLLFSTPFNQRARANLTIFASRDSGASWQFERRVDAGSSAYSALIDINTTHYGVAWESGNYGAISFQALPLPVS